MKTVLFKLPLSVLTIVLITVTILALLPACSNKSTRGSSPSTSQGSSY